MLQTNVEDVRSFSLVCCSRNVHGCSAVSTSKVRLLVLFSLSFFSFFLLLLFAELSFGHLEQRVVFPLQVLPGSSDHRSPKSIMSKS